MAARFVLTDNAEVQLIEILDYLEGRNATAAIRVKDALYDAAQMLAERPDLGHSRKDLTRRPLKS